MIRALVAAARSTKNVVWQKPPNNLSGGITTSADSLVKAVLRTRINCRRAIESLRAGIGDGEGPQAVGVGDEVGAAGKGLPVGEWLSNVGVGDYVILGLRSALKGDGEAAVQVRRDTENGVGLA